MVAGNGKKVLNCSKGNFRLDIREFFLTLKIVKHWNRSASLKVFKNRFGTHVSNSLDRDVPALD